MIERDREKENTEESRDESQMGLVIIRIYRVVDNNKYVYIKELDLCE